MKTVIGTDRMGRPIRRTDPAVRFWAKVDRREPDGCWEWTGSRNARGYGHFGRGFESNLAHRIAWTLVHGPIPPGLFVCHRCDNPPCCNPAHLFVGSAADNSRDMVQKGRSPQSFGERSGKAKLSSAQVRELREAYAAGVDLGVLAEKFDLNPTSVRNIATGWRRTRDGGAPVRRPVFRIDRARAIELYRSGLSTIAVAAAVGTYPGNISRILRAAGVAARPNGGRRDRPNFCPPGSFAPSDGDRKDGLTGNPISAGGAGS